MQLLGGLTAEQFLQEYWQKKPLLVRQAVSDFAFPLTPEELAGLACEEEVESRLVLEHGHPPWQVEHGPFAASRFAELPTGHWSLLVQKVNELLPEAARLLDRFAFVPGWRIDDLMVSYAPQGGSVGPHVDQYDVFLLQARGRRRWQIGRSDGEEPKLLENSDLKILRDFEIGEDWILEPGDMLYLPPGVPHHGVAQDDACMTWSVGFRAPAWNELLGAWYEEQLAELADSQRYRDPDLSPPRAAGEIEPPARQQVRDIIRQRFVADADIDRWFARYLTGPLPSAESGTPPPAAAWDLARLEAALHSRPIVWRNESQRFAWFTAATPGEPRHGTNEALYLYVHGEEFELHPALRDLLILLCAQREIPAADLQPWLSLPAAATLLLELFQREALEFDVPD